jgi:hypothetical protein
MEKNAKYHVPSRMGLGGWARERGGKKGQGEMVVS